MNQKERIMYSSESEVTVLVHLFFLTILLAAFTFQDYVLNL